jgi:DNA-binding response OmpR family regulator
MSASILIVHKNRFIRHMLREVLEEAGYRVSAVATTSFARVLVANHGEMFDLLLLHGVDFAGDGDAFCSALQADGFVRPIIVLCESSEPPKTSRAGVSASIHKPFTIEALLRQLQTTLKQHRDPSAPVLHRPRFHSTSR